ncbi:Nitroreductase-like, partial [Klenkia terrae]|jgi:nitroreductase
VPDPPATAADHLETPVPGTALHPDDVLQLVDLAQRAPSVHNTQPWRWRLDPAGLQLFADLDRALPATDPSGRELLLSCGAVLQHLVVVARAAGWSAQVRRFPDPADPHHLATVDLTPAVPAPGDTALAAAVAHRQTDRRAFADEPVPEGWWHQLAATAAVHRAHLVLVEPAAHRVVGQLAEAAAARIAADPRVAAETRAWSGRPAGSPDGVPGADVPAGPDPGDVPARRFATAELSVGVSPLPLRDGARLAVLATTGDRPLDQVEAGEALAAVLLHATAAGLASHVVSELVEVPDVRDRLAVEVLPPGLVPQVLVRLGRLPLHSAPLPRTGRRPAGSTIDRTATAGTTPGSGTYPVRGG